MANREYEIPLSRVKEFGREFLWADTSSVAVKILTRNLRWHSARAETLIRSDVSESDAEYFESGGKVSALDADSWLTSILKSLLKKESRFVLVENWTIKKGHNIINEYSYPAVYSEDDVFFVIENESDYFSLTCLNISPRFLGFVIDGPAPMIGADMPESALEEMSKRVSLIYFGAYDGEGYVVVTFGDQSHPITQLRLDSASC